MVLPKIPKLKIPKIPKENKVKKVRVLTLDEMVKSKARLASLKDKRSEINKKQNEIAARMSEKADALEGGKIKAATFKGIFKCDLLPVIRRKLGKERLPSRSKDNKPYSKMSRYELLILLVNEGIDGVKLERGDLLQIKRQKKQVRKSKVGEKKQKDDSDKQDAEVLAAEKQ